LLRPYGIKSHNIYPKGEKPFKGYDREDFEDTWERYLPPMPATPPPDPANVCQTEPKRTQIADNPFEIKELNVQTE
jgi:hypothetical protein